MDSDRNRHTSGRNFRYLRTCVCLNVQDQFLPASEHMRFFHNNLILRCIWSTIHYSDALPHKWCATLPQYLSTCPFFYSISTIDIQHHSRYFISRKLTFHFKGQVTFQEMSNCTPSIGNDLFGIEYRLAKKDTMVERVISNSWIRYWVIRIIDVCHSNKPVTISDTSLATNKVEKRGRQNNRTL